MHVALDHLLMISQIYGTVFVYTLGGERSAGESGWQPFPDCRPPLSLDRFTDTEWPGGLPQLCPIIQPDVGAKDYFVSC